MMTTEEKKKEITDLEKEQLRIIKKSVNDLKKWTDKPTKSSAVTLKRAFKTVVLTMKLRQLEIQKHIIASQPTLKFPKGGIHHSKTESAFISNEEKIIQPRK